MAIPDRELTLSIDPDTLTLNDLELFEAGGFSIKAFKAFMGRYSNWTAKEVGLLTLAELKNVAVKIGDALRVSSIPKASSGDSMNGPSASTSSLPAGPDV